jgi:transposase
MRIAEPEPAKGYPRWHGDEAAQRAVYANRARLRSGIVSGRAVWFR